MPIGCRRTGGAVKTQPTLVDSLIPRPARIQVFSSPPWLTETTAATSIDAARPGETGPARETVRSHRRCTAPGVANRVQPGR